MSQRPPAAGAEKRASTALRLVGLLDVLPHTPPVPFRRAPCIRALLHALATKGVETCGLAGVTVIFLAAALVTGPAAGAAVETSRQQRVDYDRSTIVVVLHKAGLLRFLGHEHGVLVKDWSAEVEYDPARPEQTKVSVMVTTSTLEIDSPQARRLAAVDPDGPNEEEMVEIRDKMLGTEQLDAEAYPTITFVSAGVEPRGDRQLRLRGTLSLHGRSREIEVRVRLEPGADGVRITGEFAIKQRDYGIEPVSIGGVVKVADELDIKFDVFLTTER